jgi:hypothetical protein
MKMVDQNGFWGRTISETAQLLIKEANRCNEDVGYIFNNITIIVSKTATVDSVVNSYSTESKRLHEVYLRSPEYQDKLAQDEKELEEAKIELENQLSIMYKLDFSNLKEVLVWLTKFQPLSDRTGVMTNSIKQEVMTTFESNGFIAGANTGDQFDENDADNYARYIIGQAMSGIQDSSIHQVLHSFVDRWLAKFN